MRVLGLAGILMALAWGEPGLAASSTPQCRQETAETFVIQGAIDAALADCVRERFQPTTHEVILQSPGGDVAKALDIAERFEGRRLTMRVRSQCASSCANYFLPLAGRIVVEPGGLIVLHGSVDPWTIERLSKDRESFVAEQIGRGVTRVDADARYDRGLVRFQGLIERQSAFAARNRIPSGWFLYREKGVDGGRIAGLSAPIGEGRYLVVEEPMLRSCLTEVEVEPFQDNLRRHWLRSFRRLEWMWTGTRPSGRTTCVPSEAG